MIVSVISPHTCGNGNTIAAIFLAFGLANLKRKVFLTHVAPKSDAFYQYLGLKAYEDKTSTPTQLVKLMREGAIQPDEIADYCRGDIDNLNIFTNNKTNFTEKDMKTLLDYVLDNKGIYEYKIIDIDTSVDTDAAAMALKKSGIVVINVTQSFLELNRFNEEKDKILKLCRGKKIILLCNKFSSIISKDKDVPQKLGVKTRCNVIHYNPWVVWGCNNGKLIDVYKRIKIKDVRVIELGNDISSLANIVAKVKIMVIKEELKGRHKGGKG